MEQIERSLVYYDEKNTRDMVSFEYEDTQEWEEIVRLRVCLKDKHACYFLNRDRVEEIMAFLQQVLVEEG